jgi:hypothetical protein
MDKRLGSSGGGWIQGGSEMDFFINWRFCILVLISRNAGFVRPFCQSLFLCYNKKILEFWAFEKLANLPGKRQNINSKLQNGGPFPLKFSFFQGNLAVLFKPLG